RVLASFDRKDGPGLVRVDDGHSKDGTASVGAGGRIHHVVGANDEGDVALGHFGIDLVHLDQIGVRNVGFGKKDIHVARHSSGDRVDGELYRDPPFLQLVVELA